MSTNCKQLPIFIVSSAKDTSNKICLGAGICLFSISNKNLSWWEIHRPRKVWFVLLTSSPHFKRFIKKGILNFWNYIWGKHSITVTRGKILAGINRMERRASASFEVVFLTFWAHCKWLDLDINVAVSWGQQEVLLCTCCTSLSCIVTKDKTASIPGKKRECKSIQMPSL